MNRVVKVLLIDMLKRLGDIQSNSGCNDYDLPNTREYRAFIGGAMAANAPDFTYENAEETEIYYSQDGRKIQTSDFIVSGHLLYLLENDLI